MDFKNIKALPKYCAYSGKKYVYLIPNFANTLFFTLACKNYPMKSNWWNLALCLATSDNKYVKVIIEAVGDQVSPTNYLFYRSPISTIISLSLSRLPSDCILYLQTSMHGVTGSSFSGSSKRNSDCWLNY